MEANRKKILVFSSFYLPGYKAGGPVKTLENMVNHLSDNFEFWIVTRDRDLGDKAPYQSVKLDEWNAVGKANVFYASSNNLTRHTFSKIIDSQAFGAIYLNSFFDINLTVKVLIARMLGLYRPVPIVIAPRGEFSKGALALKKARKSIFVRLVMFIGLYKNITWQASSALEREDIISTLGVNPQRIHIAKDLPTSSENKVITVSHDEPTSNELQVVFLSRISPMKNLDYALQVLCKVKVPVNLDIYGPQEDSRYWQSCSLLISQLPENIKVNYCGSVDPDDVPTIFSKSDVFLFPTRGENYGHVIAESLNVGTPVIISDQTPWLNLKSDHLGWDLPLSNMSGFVDAVEFCYSLSLEQRKKWRDVVVKNARLRIFNSEDVSSNKLLFLSVMRTE